MFCPDASETDIQHIARQIMALYDNRGLGGGGRMEGPGEVCAVRDKESGEDKRTEDDEKQSSLS